MLVVGVMCVVRASIVARKTSSDPKNTLRRVSLC